MIYSAVITTPGQPTDRSVFFAARDTASALALTQGLGAALNSYQPTLVAGPRMCCCNTGEVLGARDALGGPDNFDPLLVADADYREGYRKTRIKLVGIAGLSPRENAETLPF